jgi:hypothetical protein
MDLQTEYTLRHKINVVVGTPDSYVLFKSEQSLYAATMAYRPRTVSYCKECSSGLMAIELWMVNQDGIGMFHHSHVRPDQDIVEKIKQYSKFKNSKIELIRFKGDNDLTNLIWKTLGKKGEKTEEEMMESVRDGDFTVSKLALIISTISFRKHPLLFDAIKDT